MKRALAILALVALPASAQVLPGHRLPEGPERPVRDRAYHIKSYKAELRFDMAKEEIAGVATVTFESLRAPLTELSLDAARLRIEKVERDGKALAFTLDPKAFRLNIALGEPVVLGRDATVKITYAVQPARRDVLLPEVGGARGAGLELRRGRPPLRLAADLQRHERPLRGRVRRDGAARVHGRGQRRAGSAARERGRHAHLPLGRGEADPELPRDGRRRQFRPRSPGRREGRLHGRAARGLGRPGIEEAAKYTFGNTPQMVEFFSERMGYPYPWVKYDQVLLRDFAVGAMETTTMTGLGESHLHQKGDPFDSSPGYEEALPIFTYEDTISHELAHHWFGDMVTCRSLGSIWLNESFATFWHTVWNGHAHGEDDLTYQRWWYLNKYVDYVRSTGTVRPMEFLHYREPTADVPDRVDVREGLARPAHGAPLHGRSRFLPDDLRVPAPARVLVGRVGGPRRGDRARERAELLLVLPGLGRGRRRASALRRVVPLGSGAQAGGPDGQADPGGPPVRERVPPAGGRRDRGRLGRQDAPRRAVGLVHDGGAAGGGKPTPGDVRQGRLARVRGQVRAADRRSARRARARGPRGAAAGGAAARERLPPRSARRRRALGRAGRRVHALGTQAGGGARPRADGRAGGGRGAREGARGPGPARPSRRGDRARRVRGGIFRGRRCAARSRRTRPRT